MEKIIIGLLIFSNLCFGKIIKEDIVPVVSNEKIYNFSKINKQGYLRIVDTWGCLHYVNTKYITNISIYDNAIYIDLVAEKTSIKVSEEYYPIIFQFLVDNQ